jgi:hypothetical protein
VPAVAPLAHDCAQADDAIALAAGQPQNSDGAGLAVKPLNPLELTTAALIPVEFHPCLAA